MNTRPLGVESRVASSVDETAADQALGDQAGADQTGAGSFNVDLVHQSRPLMPSAEPLCLRPPWPQRGKNLKHLVPSNPDSLKHWRPIGVLETVIDREVPPERRWSRRVVARS